MFKCPSCNNETITFWQKAYADRFKHHKCYKCGAKLFVTVSSKMKHYYRAFPAMALIAVCTFYFKLWWLYPFGFVPFIWAFRKSILETKLWCCQTNLQVVEKTKSHNFSYAAQSPLHSESESLLCCLKVSRFCKCLWWLKWL